MKRIVGCAAVRKVCSGPDYQDVTVTDNGSLVRLTLSGNSYPADLTPEEARHIADALLDAAARSESTAIKK